MADHQNKPSDPKSLDVTELEDSELEEAAGGLAANSGCTVTNYGCSEN